MNLSKFFKTLGLTTALAISSAVLVQQNESIAAPAGTTVPSTVCSTVLTYDGSATVPGSLVPAGGPPQAPKSATEVIVAGDTLIPGECVLSPNASASANASGSFLAFQKDGNLVLYSVAGQKVLYSSGTAGKGTPYQTVMQSDGNFVVYSTTSVLWSSNTSGKSGSFVQVQDDGNLVIYQMATTPQFSTGTFVSK